MDTNKPNQNIGNAKKHRVLVVKDESFEYGQTKKNFFRGQLINIEHELYDKLKTAGIIVDAP